MSGAAPAQSPKPAELTADEKNLLAHSYKLEVRNGQNYFCRSEIPLGTRFPSKVCMTTQQRAALTQDSKDMATKVQRPGMDRAQ